MTTDLLRNPTPYAPDAVEDLTRRGFVTGLIAAGLLTGRGGDGDSARASSQPAYPRTVRDAAGNDVVLTSRPERVVSIFEHVTLDSLLALGIQPVAVGTRPGQGLPSWTAAVLDDTAFTFLFSEPPLERIAAARPDLIVTYNFEEESVLAIYRRIAPTVQLEPAAELRILGEVFARRARCSSGFVWCARVATTASPPSSPRP